MTGCSGYHHTTRSIPRTWTLLSWQGTQQEREPKPLHYSCWNRCRKNGKIGPSPMLWPDVSWTPSVTMKSYRARLRVVVENLVPTFGTRAGMRYQCTKLSSGQILTPFILWLSQTLPIIRRDDFLASPLFHRLFFHWCTGDSSTESYNSHDIWSFGTTSCAVTYSFFHLKFPQIFIIWDFKKMFWNSAYNKYWWSR